MQKDYWNISKRNFKAVAIMSIFFAILYGLTALDSPSAVQNALLIPVAILVIMSILFFVIASLFRRHSPMAIKVGYAYVGLVLVYNLIAGFIIGSPTSGMAYKVLGFVVLVYLLVNIYKASKQSVSSVS